MNGNGVTANGNNIFGGLNSFKQRVTPEKGFKLPRVSVSASKTLTHFDLGTVQNVSASDTVTAISITLPAVLNHEGEQFVIAIGVSVPTTVAPNGTDRILPKAATVPATNGASGSALVLLGTPQGWVRLSQSGTWA